MTIFPADWVSTVKVTVNEPSSDVTFSLIGVRPNLTRILSSSSKPLPETVTIVPTVPALGDTCQMLDQMLA